LARRARRGADTGAVFRSLVCLHSALDGAFFWEQRAVAIARLVHWQLRTTSLYSFRRSIHRIEKGLATRPRREVFAADYIGETVAFLGLLAEAYEEGCTEYREDIAWGATALRAYFAAVKGEDRVEHAREAFQRLALPAGLVANGGEGGVVRPKMPEYGFGIADLLHLARTRHSIRDYLDRPVPRDVIDAAISVAIESPSACNRQAFSFRVFDEPDLVREVAKIPIGIDHADHQIPVLVVLVGNLGAYPEPRDRHLIYIDVSLAAMAFVFGLQVQGVASCCVNWPDIHEREKRMQELLGLASTERPVMLVTAGYLDPEGFAPSSAKRSLEEMRVYNRTVAGGSAHRAGDRVRTP